MKKKEPEKHTMSLRLPKALISALDDAREEEYGIRKSRQKWVLDAILTQLKREKKYIQKELEETTDYSLILFSLNTELLKAIDSARVSSFGQKRSRSAWILESITKKIESHRKKNATANLKNEEEVDFFSTAEAVGRMQRHNWQRLHLLVGFKPDFNAFKQKKTNLKKLIKKELKEATYDLNQPDLVGWTPLHYAVHQEELTALLLESSKIKVNSLDFLKNTPLYYAVATQNLPAIQALLRAPEIDLYQKNWAGETVFDVATKKKDLKVLKLLEERSKKIPPS